MARPPIEFDLAQVEGAGQIHASYEEMAALFGCSHDTIGRRMDDEESEFCVTYKRGKANGKMSLRRYLMHNAKKGNVAAQIWLSKQHLGMMEPRDKIMQKEVEELKAENADIQSKIKELKDASTTG